MRAYQELDRDELTETRRGQGTFITSDTRSVGKIRKTLAQDAVQAFVAAMKELGLNRDLAQALVEEGDW